MVTATLVWVSMRDSKVCDVCKALDGYEWIVDLGAEKSPFNTTLVHPTYGEVWNMRVGSGAHGHFAANTCRCTVIVADMDYSDLLAKVTELADRIEAAFAEGAAKGDEQLV
jgi:hypothetical protein